MQVAADRTLTPAEFAEQVRVFLLTLDLGRWRASTESAARRALVDLHEGAAELAARWNSSPWTTEDGLRAAFTRLADALPDPHNLTDHADFKQLQEQLHPLYESLAEALRPSGAQLAAIRPTNYSRNLFHAGMGVAILLLYVNVLTPRHGMWAAVGFCVFAWSLEFLRQVVPGLNDVLMAFFKPIAHSREWNHVNSGTWFGTAMLLLLLTAPGIAGVLGLIALSLGDPAAGIVGRRFGRIRVWNGRSLEGSLAFLVVAATASAVFLTVYHPYLGAGSIAVLACTTGLAGAVVELVSTKVDDNLAVPVGTAWVTALVAWLVGI